MNALMHGIATVINFLFETKISVDIFPLIKIESRIIDKERIML